MNIDISVESAKALRERVGEDTPLAKLFQKSPHYGADTISLDYGLFQRSELDIIYDFAKETLDRSLMMQVAGFRNAMDNPFKNKLSGLKAIIPALVKFLATDAIDGWLYKLDDYGNPLPVVVTKMEYSEGGSRDDRPYVEVSYSANSVEGRRSSMKFHAEDCQKTTIVDLLLDSGYHHETPELRALYNASIARFEEVRPQHSRQFWLTEQGGRRYDRTAGQLRGPAERKKGLQRFRVVNEEATTDRKIQLTADRSWWEKRATKDHDGVGQLLKDSEDVFTQLPIHPYVRVFHLELHDQMWAHVSQLDEYVYNTTLGEKIVLPEMHRDLIDVLTSNLDKLKDTPGDFIEGKFGGNTILCKGEPGLGKTLTAEVYSEVTERVLYRVHSGQLGLAPDDVEKNLKHILTRAERWNAVCLIDECDTYVRKRGDDLRHNAIVAAFLRTMEYFNGLMFLTTNRVDDVDDAIESRCIAVIRYEYPDRPNLKRIWNVLQDSLADPEERVDDETLDRLLDKFEKMSGRDVKNVLNLALRVARGNNRALDFETIRMAAQFKGL